MVVATQQDQSARVAQLQAQLAQIRARKAKLQEQIAQLQAQIDVQPQPSQPLVVQPPPRIMAAHEPVGTPNVNPFQDDFRPNARTIQGPSATGPVNAFAKELLKGPPTKRDQQMFSPEALAPKEVKGTLLEQAGAIAGNIGKDVLGFIKFVPDAADMIVNGTPQQHEELIRGLIEFSPVGAYNLMTATGTLPSPIAVSLYETMTEKGHPEQWDKQAWDKLTTAQKFAILQDEARKEVAAHPLGTTLGAIGTGKLITNKAAKLKQRLAVPDDGKINPDFYKDPYGTAVEPQPGLQSPPSPKQLAYLQEKFKPLDKAIDESKSPKKPSGGASAAAPETQQGATPDMQRLRQKLEAEQAGATGGELATTTAQKAPSTPPVEKTTDTEPQTVNLDDFGQSRPNTATKPRRGASTYEGVKIGDIVVHNKEGYTVRVDKLYDNGKGEFTVIDAPDGHPWKNEINQGRTVRSSFYQPVTKNFTRVTRAGKSENLPVTETPTPPVEKSESSPIAIPTGKLVRAKTNGVLGTGKGVWATDNIDNAKIYGDELEYVDRPKNPLNMEIQEAFDKYIGDVEFSEATDAQWNTLADKIKAEGYDALEITAPFDNAKDTWVFDKPTKSATTSSEVTSAPSYASGEKVEVTYDGGKTWLKRTVASGTNKLTGKPIEPVVDLNLDKLGGKRQTMVNLVGRESGATDPVSITSVRKISNDVPEVTSAQPADAGGTGTPGKSASVAESAPVSAGEGGRKQVVGDKYYINVRKTKNAEPTFESVDGDAIKISGYEDADLFVHRGYEKTDWAVSEGKSGLSIARGTTKGEAIREAQRILGQPSVTPDELEKRVQQSIQRNGASPRGESSLYSGRGDVDTIAREYASALGQGLKDYHVKFAQALANKDAKVISDIVAQSKGSNEVSKRFFTKHTGIQLPSTIEGKRQAIYNWAGQEVPIPEPKPEAPPKMSRDEAFAKAQQARRDAALSVKMRHNGGEVITKREFIEGLVRKGNLSSTKEKNGKTEYRITTDGDAFVVVTKTEFDYFNELQSGRAKPPATKPILNVANKPEESAPTGNRTISELLSGKKTARIGTIVASDGTEYPLSVRPDNSVIGTYSIVMGDGGSSRSFRMQYKGGMGVADALKAFDEYMSIDNPESVTIKSLSGQVMKSGKNTEKTVAQKSEDAVIIDEASNVQNQRTRTKESPEDTGEEAQPGRRGKDTGSDSERGSSDISVQAGDEGISSGARSAVDDVSRNEQSARTGVPRDKVPAESGRVEGLGTPERPSQNISRNPSDELVSKSTDGDVRTDKRTPVGQTLYDLREKDSVLLTRGERKRLNADAKDLLKKDPKDITDADREVLRQYTGEGGLSSGTVEALNQHYTDYVTIRSIYDAIDKSGFKFKTALEPAVGAGSFVGNRPQAKWTTVDIDETNHEVVRRLYPNASHYNTSYESFTDTGFDLVISNVPFSEQRGAGRIANRKDIKALHDFYFVHSLDRVKDDGVIAFITSTGTMDKVDSRIREEIVEKADIIGAFRLPQGHFTEGSHTDVTTDIIFMHKRPNNAVPTEEQTAINDQFVRSTKGEENISLSEYYRQNPNNILGSLTIGKDKLHGGKETYVITGPADLSRIAFDYKPYGGAKSLGDFMGTKYKDFVEWARENKVDYKDGDDPNFAKRLIVDTRQGTVLEGGEIQRFSDVDYRVRVYSPIGGETAKKLLALEHIRERAGLYQETMNRADAERGIQLIDSYRQEFSKHPADDAKLKRFMKDHEEESYLLELGSYFDKDFIPGDVFREKTRYIQSGEIEVDTKSPLLHRAFRSENNKGAFVLEKNKLIEKSELPELLNSGYSISRFNGKTTELQNDILFESGNIYDKIENMDQALEAAKSAKRKDLIPVIEKQKARLEAIKPEPVQLEEVRIKGSEPWLTDIIQKFDIRTGTYRTVDAKTGNTEWAHYNKVIANHLNNRALISRKGGEDWIEPMDEYMGRMQDAEAEVDQWIDDIRAQLAKNPEALQAAEYSYNAKMRSYVKPDYKKASYLIRDILDEIAANSPITLRENQINWVVKALYEGRGINSHGVGAGKTYTAIALGRAMKKRGIAQKPMYVVPAKTINKWHREIKNLFPDAKVISLGKLHQDKRKQALFELSNTNADFVLIAHEGFEQIKLPKNVEEKYIAALLREHLDKADVKGREKAKLELKVDAYRDALKKEIRDARLTFDKLGIDAIIVDEAHRFKNIGINSELQKFNLGTGFDFGDIKTDTKTGEAHARLKSARSYDLRFKANWIVENNNDKNVFLLTATPTTNKPMEIYTMLRHLSPDVFKEYGIRSDRDFANMFFDLGTMKDPNKNKPKNVLKSIVNAIELRGILDRFVDKIQTSDMPWIKVPKANVFRHFLEQSSGYAIIAEDLVRRQQALPARPQQGDDMAISIYTNARAAAIDPRLYTGQHAGVTISTRSFDPSDDKVEFVISEASKRLKANSDHHQLIFLDKSGEAMKKAGDLPEDLHTEIKKELVKRGLKPTEVAIINGQVVTNVETGKDTASGDIDDKKQAVSDAYNAGKIKVIIGTTQSMGEGMDLQVKTKDIWHLDIPYTPGEFEQRNGRGVRQGNIHDEVNIHYVFMKGTFDTMSYRLVSTKKGWNEAIWDKELSSVISTADEMVGGAFPSPEEVVIEIETDPLKKHGLIVNYQLDRLKAEASEVVQLRRATTNRISRYESAIRKFEEQLKERQETSAALVPDEKIKDAKRRQEAFETSKRHIDMWIDVSRRNIEEQQQGLSKSQQRLREIESLIETQRDRIRDFEMRYFDEHGEVLPVDKPFTEVADIRNQYKSAAMGERIRGGPRKTPPQRKPVINVSGTARETTQGNVESGAPGENVTKQEIIDHFEKAFKIPLRSGRVRGQQHGIYKPDDKVIRSRTWGDIINISHEIGHHVESTLYRTVAGGPRMSRVPLAARKELVQLGQLLYESTPPAGGYRSEGFAEFLAHYLVGHDTGTIAPEFNKFFDEMLKNNSEMKAILEKGRKLVTRWYEQGALNRVRMSREHDLSFAEKLKSIPDAFSRERYKKSLARFRDLWVNPGATIELFESEARNMKARVLMDPTKVRPTTSPSQTYRAESFGAQSMARAMVNYGVFDYEGNQTYKSLREVLEPVSKDIDNFMDYAVSRRALDLHARGINPGIDRADAEFTSNELESQAFSDALDDLTKWQDKAMDYLVDAGGLSKEAANAMRDLNPVYVPFKRMMGDRPQSAGVGRQMGDVKSPIMKIKGSGRQIKDPLESIIEQTAKIISTANRIRVGRLIVDLAENTGGMGKWVEKIPMPQEATKFALDDIREALHDAGIDMEDADLSQIVTIYQNSNRGVPKDNIVTIWRDGKIETYQFDKQLYQSVMNLDGVGPNVFLKIFGAPARLKRLFVTGINPAFALTTNPIRDAFTFALQSKYTAGSPHKIVMGLVRKFFPNEANKVYLRSGSDMGQILGMDKNSLKEAVAEVLANDKKARAMGIVKHPVDAMREMLSFTESGPRRAEFEAAHKKLSKQYGAGADARIGATVAAKDVTTDFTRIGKYAQYVNGIVPFFNAQIQGVSKFARTVADNPKRSLAYGLGLTAITAAIWWEEKDEPWYRKLPAWRKYGFWNFNVGEHDDGTPYILSIPIPFEWGLVFKAIPEAMLNAHYEDDPAAMKELVGQITKQLGLPMMPAAIEPVIETSTNYDMFQDRQIVPEWMNKNKLPEDQYFESTPKTYRELGARLGYSPAKLQHLVEGYTGNLITQGIRNVEQGVSIEQPADIPVVGKLFIRQYSAEENEEFAAESWERTRAKVTVLIKGGRFDEARKTVKEWGFKNSASDSPHVLGELAHIDAMQKNYAGKPNSGRITLNKKAI